MAMKPRPQNQRRRAPAGASPKRSRRSNRRFGRVLVKVFASATVAGLLVTLVVWADPLAQLKKVTNRPIAGVVVEGQFEYLSQQKIQALVVEQVTDNFLQLDMEALKAAMEQNPWVDRVAVSRQWPDRLVVRVEEQRPIARWGNDAFVNMRGDIVEVSDNSPLSDLPLLSGEDRYAKDVMHKYVQIARLLSPAEMGLQEVRLDATLSWSLRLKNGLSIEVGRDQVFEKLQRLLDVFRKELAGKADQIASIDLRYDNGFAVAWKQTGIENLAMTNGK